jgi:hypothetical protein
VLSLLLSLTLAVLLSVTGAASMAHGLASGQAGHHAMEGHGDGDAAMAALDDCCDATGTAGGGCLIDAAPIGASARRSVATSRARPLVMTLIAPDGLAAAVPTGPPKV